MRTGGHEYREMLWELGEYEGWRARRWPLCAVGLMAAVWLPPFAVGVGSFYLGESSDSFLIVALSVAATLGAGGIASALSSRRPWRKLIERRKAAYWQESEMRDYAGALIDVDDFSRAMHALRRAGLNAHGRSAVALPAASSTSSLLSVFRPAICVRAGQESVCEATWRALQEAGIDAEVDGHQDGKPIASTVLRFGMPPVGEGTQ